MQQAGSTICMVGAFSSNFLSHVTATMPKNKEAFVVKWAFKKRNIYPFCQTLKEIGTAHIRSYTVRSYCLSYGETHPVPLVVRLIFMSNTKFRNLKSTMLISIYTTNMHVVTLTTGQLMTALRDSLALPQSFGYEHALNILSAEEEHPGHFPVETLSMILLSIQLNSENASSPYWSFPQIVIGYGTLLKIVKMIYHQVFKKMIQFEHCI